MLIMDSELSNSELPDDVVIPEPASIGLVLLSVGGLVLRRVRKS
jgi:hypothetical protein